MISLLSRVIAAIRVWVGLNDPSARNRAMALAPAPIPAARGKRL